MVIRKNNYLSVPAHARLTYDLRGNELLAYGLIHGFSQDGSSWYEGGQQYVADWCGISRRAVRDVLSRLVSIGAIERQEVVVNNVTFCKYRAILTEEESSAGDGKKVPQGAEESSHNNTNSTSSGNIVVEDNYSSRTINSTSNNNSTSTPKNSKKGFEEKFDLSFIHAAFEDTYKKWLRYKQERGEMYKTQMTLEENYRRLLTIANNDPWTAQQIVDYTISGGWMGYCMPKQTQQSYGNTTRNPWCDVADAITAAGGIL